MIEEIYANRTLKYETTMGHPTARWRPHPLILVGGSINKDFVDVYEPKEPYRYSNDWNHLAHELGIAAVLNTEIEQSDAGKGSAEMVLCECGVLDNSLEYPPEIILRAVEWSRKVIQFGAIYMHCHMGGGRSAAFAYAILRSVLGLSSEESLQTIQQGKDWCYKLGGQIVGGSITEYPSIQWGETGHTKFRIEHIEKVLAGKAR